MDNARRTTAQKFIVAGYFVIFVGTLIEVIWQISNQYFQQSWRVDVDTFSIVFASFAAIIAWWFLSRIVAETSSQTSLIRKAYFGLALQALLLSSNFVLFLTGLPNLSWGSASTWGYCVGTISTAIGFFLMATSYPTSETTSDKFVVKP
ncbi:MAG TPA: hypothetical protein VGZ68_10345 [Acidimicrobiales bacterium]|jgi:hypothetical protein|nr:hypothetical protein [Acidimicrobiales bacterium]